MLFVCVTAEIKQEDALFGDILGILIAVDGGCHCCD